MAFYSVRMGSLVMNGTPDANGDVFMVRDLEGLWGPDVDYQSTQNGDMGSRLDVWRYKELHFTLKGTASSRGDADFDVVRLLAKLNANAFPDAGGLLYIDQAAGYVPLQISVVRAGALHLPAPEHNVQEFEIDFIAPDPRKYSQAVQQVPVSGVAAVAVNHGTVETFATATLSSSATNPYLEHSTQGRITLPGSIPAGTIVSFGAKETIHPTSGVIEMASRPRVWWSLKRGNNTITASGSWNLQWLDAYV